jgi:hypothetical protein
MARDTGSTGAPLSLVTEGTEIGPSAFTTELAEISLYYTIGMNFREFTCTSRTDGTVYHCFFIFLQTAISLRHSDTVDVRFQVNGTRITVALPHVTFVEYAHHSDIINDERAARIAATYLCEVLADGGSVEDLTVPAARVLQIADQVEVPA